MAPDEKKPLHYLQVAVTPGESESILFGVIEKLDERMDGIAKELADAVIEMRLHREGINKLLAGFPDADPVSHRREHEEAIRKLKAKADFWEKMKWEITKWGLIGFLGWALLELWNSFIRGPHS